MSLPIKRRGLNITLTLIIIDALFFLFALIILYSNKDFVNYIALQPAAFLSGEKVWTLLTNMFMHADVWHLAMNMISLLFLGSFLEMIIGKKRFLIFYLLAGIFAGLFFIFSSFLFQQNMDALAVGASGAIFGIAGLLAVLTPKLPVYVMFIPIALPMWFASILILGLLWLFSLLANLPIGNTAHLGGLIAGLIYGFYLRTKYSKRIRMLNRMLGMK